MPVIVRHLTPNNALQPGYATAQVLAQETVLHFAAVRGMNVGVGPASCCAALAVQPSHQFPALPGQGFGVAFGNSQVAAGGLDQGPVGNHAERCALTAAGNNHLALTNPAVMFVELAPCNGCLNWLEGNGGGVANPYDFGPYGDTLNVWYAFDYPDVNQALQAFHLLPIDQQQAAVALW